MIEIEELTIASVHASFKNGTYTCRQLIEAYFTRIEK
jgi:Asp-tRNA(Asn)/Glu-tRNA(Gln) amidotransferase A subunit family amidase